MTGKETAAIIKEHLKEEVSMMTVKPKLVVIQVGDNDASNIYIANKHKACLEVGIEFELKKYLDATMEEMLNVIDECNNDSSISGILIQLPLPNHLDEKTLTNKIDPAKDVDGLTILSQGLLMNDSANLISCTPKGIYELLKLNNIGINGKHVVVVGRSNLVGKPVAMLMLNHHATVTVCHSRTNNLELYTKMADILIVAVGKVNIITADMVKDGAVVIDVGMNRSDGKLCGDVAYESIKDKCTYITPVPGGVGPMTIAALLENVVVAHKQQKSVN